MLTKAPVKKKAGAQEQCLEKKLRQWLDYTELSAYYKLQNLENK